MMRTSVRSVAGAPLSGSRCRKSVAGSAFCHAASSGAPSTTIDLSIASGGEIPIEERAAEEVTHGFGRQTAPDGVAVYNPAFDVTPAELIAAIITERGVARPVNFETVRRVARP